MIKKYLPQSTAQLIHWYERYVSPIALLVGFLLDNFIFLDRIDSIQSYALITGYLTIAALAILIINLVEEGKVTQRLVLKIAPFVPVVMQFAFGGLFSAFLALYSRSASVLVSWVFVIAVATLLISNERFRARYVRLPFQAGIYFIAVFSFMLFLLPILFRQIGTVMFFLSGAVSIGIMTLLLRGLRRFVPEAYMRDRTKIARTIGIISIIFVALYLSNAIPPLPLALKDSGIYHSVTRQGGSYTVRAQNQSWYRRVLPLDERIHIVPGSSLYAYTAVFAPTGLSTKLVHEWQYYEPGEGWTTRSTVGFQINGGTDRGFRGYSIKVAPEEGEWRVNVLTTSRQIIGRLNFRVFYSVVPPTTHEEAR
jgi:hypothetical protein